jgi:hypothetical protein
LTDGNNKREGAHPDRMRLDACLHMHIGPASVPFGPAPFLFFFSKKAEHSEAKQGRIKKR